VGTWRLVSFVAHRADGNDAPDYGPEPRGYLMYDEGRRMSVHIARSDQRPFQEGDQPPAGGPRKAFEGYFGYFGTYTVDENAGTVTHHIEGASDPDYVGTDQRRFIAWQGNRLILSTSPEGAARPDVMYVATWQREP